MMGVATNIVAAWPTLSRISNCHPAFSVFDTNILLSYAIKFVQVSVGRYGLVTKNIASAFIDYIIACAAVPCPWTGCCHEIKTTKINFEGLSDFPRKLPAIRYYTFQIVVLSGEFFFILSVSVPH